MLVLLHLQLIRLVRTLKGGGPGLVFMPFLFAFAIFAVYKVFLNIQQAWILFAATLLVITAIHRYRKDHRFVLYSFDKPRLQWGCEYSFFLLPISIPALFTPNFFLFFLLHVIVFIIVFIPPQSAKGFKTKAISYPIHSSDFELIATLRKSFLLLFTLYFLAFLLTPVRMGSLLLIWLISLQFSNGFEQHESLDCLRWNQVSSKDFLRNKIIRQTRFLFLLSLPIILLHGILVPEEALLSVMFLLNQLVLLALALVFKYASFQPGYQSSSGNVLMSIMGLSALIPFLLPIPFLMLLLYYPKAIQRLNQYLYA